MSSITGTVRGIVNPTFTYDADGNQLSGAGIVAAYTSFDMPATVSSATWGSFVWGQAPWGASYAMAYDSEHQRVSMTGAGSTTLYWNDPISGVKSEFATLPTGATQWRDYLMADGRMVAQRTAITGGATTFQYFVEDHLGSIAVSTNGSGAVIERMTYDPWGEQLDQNGNPLCGSGAAPTTRGYTGEEQFPAGCLVNLNARLYDPLLGRFMVGDPVIATVYDQQSLNRYAYVRDNPLSLTDTNGQCPICVLVIANAISVFVEAELLKPLFAKVPLLGNLFVISDAIGCFISGGPAAAAVCSAESSGIVAGVESGNAGKGLQAFAITAAEAIAFYGIGQSTDYLSAKGFSIETVTATSIIAHGLVGGTFSVAQGGKFGSGFLAAGASDISDLSTSSDNLLVGAIKASVIGGTASVIGGGKFGNGAETGTFGYLFNHLGNAIAGTEATYAIGRALNERDGGGWHINKGAFLDLFINGRADLVSPTGEVYEVKTNVCLNFNWCKNAASKQLGDYIKSASVVDTLSVGTFDTIFKGEPAIWASGTALGIPVSYRFEWRDDGLVGYNIDDSQSVLSQILRSLMQRRSTSAPAPPVIPVPVIEF